MAGIPWDAHINIRQHRFLVLKGYKRQNWAFINNQDICTSGKNGTPIYVST